MNNIQPGIPIAQQQQMQQQSQAQNVEKSPFEPTDMQLDIMTGKFDRNAYNQAYAQRQAQQNTQAQPVNQQQTTAVPQQTAAPMKEIDPAFLSNVEKRLQSFNPATVSQQQAVVQPVQAQAPVTQTQPPVAQNEVAKTDQGNEDWLKALLAGTNDAKTTNTQQPGATQPQANAQTQGGYNIKPEEAKQLTSYLEENQKYFNAIELESKRIGVDPLKVAEALSKKPISEVVSFALGNANVQVASSQAAQVTQQAPQNNLPDPVDTGRLNAPQPQLNNEVQVFGGDRHFTF